MVMRQQIEARLNELKREYDKGETQLHQLECQLTSLRETVLRINGAIRVLEELLSSSAVGKPIEEASQSNSACRQSKHQREEARAQAHFSDENTHP
jgi:hypothetical protein